MTLLNGFITLLCIYGADNDDNWSTDLSGFDQGIYLDLETAESGLLSIHAQRTIVYPYVYAPQVNGFLDNCYLHDFYFRIHLYPNPLNLGNMLSDMAENVWLWNAFFEQKILYSVDMQGASGIVLTEPESAPTTYNALEERQYIISISMEGPPTIDASIIFNFDDSYVLPITGSRVVLWRWRPDLPLTERLEWNTKILGTRDSEQRVALRNYPRQILSFSFTKRAHEFAAIKTASMEWNFRLWGLPIWFEQVHLNSVVKDATSINFSTTAADFRSGGLAVLWESPDKLEAVEISSVRVNGIDIEHGVSQNYTNVFIMPLRLAYTTNGISISRPDNHYAIINAQFMVTDNADLADTIYDQYRDYDVLVDGDIIIGNINENISRPLITFDNGQGAVTYETGQDWTNFSRTLGKVTHGKDLRWAWRCWLHSRRGRQKAFWLPTWNNDLTIISDIGSSDLAIQIMTIGMTRFTALPVDIMISLHDGTVFYRRILDVSTITNLEMIVIDSDLGREVSTTEIAICCFMNLVRLNSDNIEIMHEKPTRTRTSIPVMEVAE
jgi:hypothetical protein